MNVFRLNNQKFVVHTGSFREIRGRELATHFPVSTSPSDLCFEPREFVGTMDASLPVLGALRLVGPLL